MTRWLDRTLTQCAYYFCLILNEADFHKELRKLKLPEHRWTAFLNPTAHATTHQSRVNAGKIHCLYISRHNQTVEGESRRYQGACVAVLLAKSDPL